MNQNEEQFQERLARLEAGEPLTTAGADLPQEEAAALVLAAELKDVTLPEPEETAVLYHRAAAVRAAQAAAAKPKAESVQTGWLAVLLAWWRNNRTVAWGITAVAAVLVVFLVGSLLNRQTEPATSVADQDEDRPAQTAEGADETADEDSVSLLDRLFGGDEPVADEPIVEEAPAEVPETTGVAEADDTAPDAAAGADLPYETFLPNLLVSLETTSQTAVLGDLNGLVTVQQPDGRWQQVSYLSSVGAGSRVRTGPLSSASLTFYDGSVAKLGPDSEVSIDNLNALRPDVGFRTVVMTQWQGSSSHDVAFRNDGGSRYEVKSPNGTGIARGTIFDVVVLPGLTSRYTVLEGRVDVTSISVTVSVMAGQLTTIPVDLPPTQPQFQVSGEGEVTQIGETWLIGGQTFGTNDQTVIVGNPQVGDWVTVQGHLLDDGTKVADQIVLVREVPQNAFTLTAVVTQINTDQWQFGDLVVSVDEETVIDPTIELDDWVRVSGVILEDGSLLASRLQRLPDDGAPFEFIGVVQTIGEDSWQISGIDVAVNDRTEIKDNPQVGDLVKVEGQITANGVWLAREIKADDDEETAKFEFIGLVETVDPWLVADIALATDEWTEIDTAVALGDLVKVEGIILPDGNWLAEEIKLLDDDDDEILLRFTGVVESTDPWIVGGITLLLTDDSQIADGITEGTLVEVAARLAEDGSWEIVWLRPLLPPTTGCFTVHAQITTVNGSQIVLTNWPALTLDDDVSVEGNLLPNSTVAVTICLGEDDTVFVVNIVVIQVIIDLPPPGSDGNDNDDDDGGNGNGRVTICHKGNTLTISQSGLNGHLGHGDTLGPCGSDDGDHDDDDDD
ncbi:DUF5666 domain-containing protein [Candidatus Leptofilum sp.]|uniref:DUF5666 domain-containing protein n=1 Tax=Candidatus Leptofilum sp. TaxID=3241576 RepID=UPI003B5A0592